MKCQVWLEFSTRGHRANYLKAGKIYSLWWEVWHTRTTKERSLGYSIARMEKVVMHFQRELQFDLSAWYPLVLLGCQRGLKMLFSLSSFTSSSVLRKPIRSSSLSRSEIAKTLPWEKSLLNTMTLPPPQNSNKEPPQGRWSSTLHSVGHNLVLGHKIKYIWICKECRFLSIVSSM